MDQPAVGDHLLRAVYSGDGVVLGTTSTRIRTISMTTTRPMASWLSRVHPRCGHHRAKRRRWIFRSTS